MDSPVVLEIAAFGKEDVTPGTLYNHHKQSFENPPWNKDDLSKHIQIREQRHTEFGMVISDSLEEKSSALRLDFSVKASVFFGLYKTSGSAGYLEDNRSTKEHARVAVNYRATSQVKELSLYQLGNLDHLSGIDKGLATHVVTAVLYGAQVFLVFDRKVSEKENHNDVHGNMKKIVNAISKMANDLKGVQIGLDIKNEVKDISCKYFGNIPLDKINRKDPETFEEALETYRHLPELLNHPVPMKVYMLPLKTFYSSASKRVPQISVGLVNKVQRVLEDLNELDMRCNGMLETLQLFPEFRERLNRFKDLCKKSKTVFQKSLAEKFPLIQAGEKKQAILAQILNERDCSPFNNKTTNDWLDYKEREICTLMMLKEQMKNPIFIESDKLHEEVMQADHALCFVFTSLRSDEAFLSTLSDYLNGNKFDEHDGGFHDTEKQQWYCAKEKVMAIKKKAILFGNFTKATQNKKNIKFLAMSLTDDKHKDSIIYFYKNGTDKLSLLSDDFEPLSEPEDVGAADIHPNSVTSEVSPPSFGAQNISYSIEYCVKY